MISDTHRERITALHATVKQTLADRQADKMAKIAVRKAKQEASGFPSDKSPV